MPYESAQLSQLGGRRCVHSLVGWRVSRSVGSFVRSFDLVLHFIELTLHGRAQPLGPGSLLFQSCLKNSFDPVGGCLPLWLADCSLARSPARLARRSVGQPSRGPARRPSTPRERERRSNTCGQKSKRNQHFIEEGGAALVFESSSPTSILWLQATHGDGLRPELNPLRPVLNFVEISSDEQSTASAMSGSAACSRKAFVVLD